MQHEEVFLDFFWCVKINEFSKSEKTRSLGVKQWTRDSRPLGLVTASIKVQEPQFKQPSGRSFSPADNGQESEY